MALTKLLVPTDFAATPCNAFVDMEEVESHSAEAVHVISGYGVVGKAYAVAVWIHDNSLVLKRAPTFVEGFLLDTLHVSLPTVQAPRPQRGNCLRC